MRRALFLSLVLLGVPLLSAALAAYLFPPPEPVRPDHFRLSVTHTATTASALERRILVEPDRGGRFFRFGLGDARAGFSGFGFAPLHEDTTLVIRVAAAPGGAGHLTAQVGLEAHTPHGGSRTDGINVPAGGKGTLADMVRFTEVNNALYRVGETVVLATVGGREVNLTVTDRPSADDHAK